jgi:hypothetical protein
MRFAITPVPVAPVPVPVTAVAVAPIRATLPAGTAARAVRSRGETSPGTPLGTAGPGHAAAWRADTPARAGAATTAWPLGGHGATGFEELILPAFVSMKRRYLS